MADSLKSEPLIPLSDAGPDARSQGRTSPERSTLKLFPSLVQVTDVDADPAWNDELTADILNLKRVTPNSLPEGWGCHVYTTIESRLDLFKLASFQRLREIIFREADFFSRSMAFDIDQYPLVLEDCWINVYDRGDAQERHIHRNSVISGIYYAQAPEDCGRLVFHSPMSDAMLDPPKVATNEFNTHAVMIKPEAGKMILFRSWLYHSVKPNAIEGTRVSVAFNLTM